jgi:hypothetical protein
MAGQAGGPENTPTETRVQPPVASAALILIIARPVNVRMSRAGAVS